MPSTVGSIEHAKPIPAAEREQFDRDGYLIIRGALTPDEARRYAAALDRVYAAATAGGRVRHGAAMHQLSAVASCHGPWWTVALNPEKRKAGGSGPAPDHHLSPAKTAPHLRKRRKALFLSYPAGRG